MWWCVMKGWVWGGVVWCVMKGWVWCGVVWFSIVRVMWYFLMHGVATVVWFSLLSYVVWLGVV